MPLIDVTRKPGYKLVFTEGAQDDSDTKAVILTQFGPSLPALFVERAEELGMDSGTPEDGVQVQHHKYGRYDTNVADVWVKVQFSEDVPDKIERARIRDVIFNFILDWFHNHAYNVPDNFILDVLWGPTSGCGSVNGTFIEW